MTTPRTFPAYQDVLSHLANKFYAQEKDAAALGPETLVSDLRNMLRTFAGLPRWQLYDIVERQMLQLLEYEQTLPRQRRLSIEEVIFLSDLALHIHEGQPMLRVPWPVVERVSSLVIDHDIPVRRVHDARLPDTIWMEWASSPPRDAKPWIQRTVGLLLSRLSLFDAPREHQHLALATFKEPGRESKSLAIFPELILMGAEGTPCFGYCLTVVQECAWGFRFVLAPLGHALDDPLRDMLVLQKETSDADRRKFKETEQVWSNVAVRLVLMCVLHRWLSDSLQLEVPGDVLEELGPDMSLLFHENSGEDGVIQLRSCHQPREFFRVET